MTMTSFNSVAKATIQSTFLAAISNCAAQVIQMYQKQRLAFSTAELAQFLIIAIISAPPNCYWQAWLEHAFPTYRSRAHVPALSAIGATSSAPAPASLQHIQKRSYDIELTDRISTGGSSGLAPGLSPKPSSLQSDIGSVSFTPPLPPPPPPPLSSSMSPPLPTSTTTSTRQALHLRHVLVKFFLDAMTIGALFNTVLFLVLSGMLKRHHSSVIVQSIRTETVPIIVTGCRIWPIASVVNFTLVPVEKRVVFFSLVGLVWGVYLSLVSSEL